MPQPKNPVPILFPLQGINETTPYASPTGGSIVRADHVLNMRPFDIEKRKRGGQRTGIARYFEDPVNGVAAIQNINSVVEAFDPSALIASVSLLARNYNDSSIALGELDIVDPGIWNTYTGGNGVFGTRTEGGVNSLQVLAAGGGHERSMGLNISSTITGGFAFYAGPSITLGEKYIINFTAEVDPVNSHAVVWRVAGDPTTNDHWSVRIGSSGANINVQLVRHDAGVFAFVTPDTGATVYTPSGSANVSYPYSLEVSGNTFTFKAEGNTIWTHNSATYASNTGFAFGCYENASARGNILEFEVFKAITPASLRSTKLVVTAGGDVFSGTKALGLSAVGNNIGVTKGSGIIFTEAAFQDVFFVDGLVADYNYLDLATNTIKDWATDITAGALPAGSIDTSIGSRVLALWRGRLGHTSLSEEPQNWFLSKAGDVFDYDYSPAVTNATQAVAGNASDVGELGDIVTAMIPHKDDLMFLGGDHTLWVMRGDPAAGGQIDSVSRQIGVVGPHAWAWDTGSTLYFQGQNGLYQLSPASDVPVLLSSEKVDKVFSEIDFADNTIFLLYDREWQGVEIFVSPVDQPAVASEHYWYDIRTQSFWRDQYPIAVGPTFPHLFDADLEDDRAVLLGGYDGRIRFFDINALSDDGTAITSFVRFPLLHPSIPQGQFQIDDLQMNTDSTGGVSTTLSIFRGHTPEEAAKSSVVLFSKILAPGRNLPIRKKIRGNSIQFQMGNSALGETWSFEAGTVMIQGVGRQRAKL